MATLQQLIRSTQRFKPVLFDNARSVNITQLNVTRFVGVRQVMFTAINSDPETNTRRTAQMQFTVPKGEDANSYVPKIAKDSVRVRSSSPWYKFAFGFNNQRIGAQFGRVSKFTVKGTGRPVNPGNVPGIDKHLIALTRELIRRKLIK